MDQKNNNRRPFHGGKVKGDNSGEIETSGDTAHGIYAQSVGGGGGDGV